MFHYRIAILNAKIFLLQSVVTPINAVYIPYLSDTSVYMCVWYVCVCVCGVVCVCVCVVCVFCVYVCVCVEGW